MRINRVKVWKISSGRYYRTHFCFQIALHLFLESLQNLEDMEKCVFWAG